MSNRHAEQLADEYGDLDAQIKALEEDKAKVRDEMLTYLDDVPVVGLRWTVKKSESTSTRLDTKKVRAFLGDKAAAFESKTKQTKVLVSQTQVFGKTAAE